MNLIKPKTFQSGTFPLKLYDMLEEAEENNFENIVSWLPDGKSFKVHDEQAIVPLLKSYFNQSKYRSFVRQLQNYGFSRVYRGNNRGVCKHKSFIRGQRKAASYISRNQPEDHILPVTTLMKTSRIRRLSLDQQEGKNADNSLLLSPLKDGKLYEDLVEERQQFELKTKNHTDGSFDVARQNIIEFTEGEIKTRSQMSGNAAGEDCDLDLFEGRLFYHV